MHLHLPHFNPRQRALLRNLLGAAVAILSALVLVGLMALLLIYPDKAFGFKVIPSLKNNLMAGDPVIEQPMSQAVKPLPAQPATKRVIENSALQTEIEKLQALASRSVAPANTRSRLGPAHSKTSSATLQTIQTLQTRNAAWVLGLLYLHGVGVVQDPAQALFWFKQANQQGEPWAAAGLAWCAIEGCEAPPNPVAARPWVAQLHAVKPGRAMYLEWLVESSLSPLQANSIASAQEIEKTRLARRQLLLSAARLQDVQAQIELGFESVAAERTAEAQAYFQAASATSKVAADNAKLVMHRQSDQKALCQVGNADNLPASTLLTSAQALHRGDLCQVNYFEAVRLYNLAAAKGNLIAKRMLGLIYSRPGPAGGINITWMQQLANLNVSKLSPNLDRASLPPMLQREPTALSDLIPPYLRKLSENKTE